MAVQRVYRPSLGDRLQGFALYALVAGLVGLVAGGALGVWWLPPEGDGDSEAAWGLEAGDCLRGVDARPAGSKAPVDCSEEHALEAYLVWKVPDRPARLDGDYAMNLDFKCWVELEEFVGVPAQDTLLQYTWWGPTYETYPENPYLVCFAKRPQDKPGSGSLEGAGKEYPLQ